jgi:hypothetical protein
MNNNKTPKIKAIIQKIDIGKIAEYSQKYPNSKTLRQTIKYSKRVLERNNDEKVFKLGVEIAYNLDTIVKISKYVEKEEEKKFWLGISKELFENTVGVKDKK